MSMSEGSATPVEQAVPSAGPALELRGISKSYGPVHANAGVSLVLQPGSVHAILGENGAGKSTLMKILFGVEMPDSGTILLDGVEQTFRSPKASIDAGIGMVFQHFGLVGELSALDNISLGAETGTPVSVDRRAARTRVKELSGQLGLPVPMDTRIDKLTIAQQQRVEIVKALYRGARILILDEPTALLAPQEREGLFAAIERLQLSGLSVLFITHKLEEAERLADDVTVMRLGRVVAHHRIDEVTRDVLIKHMVGEADVSVVRHDRTPGEVIVGVRDVVVAGAGSFGLHVGELSVRRGEVTGVVGIDGHGHQLFCQLLAGVRPPTSGSVGLHGKSLKRWNRRIAMRNRVGYVPEDRLAAGVARHQTIAENLVANRLRDPQFLRRGLLRQRSIAAHADEMITRFDIRCSDREQESGRLSGGNVQKVVLAREISASPELLVVCEPTRGLDIGAIANVHTQLAEAADRGASVVIQSSDLDEVISVADRIIIFREGRPVADVRNSANVNAASLGAVMLGSSAQSAKAGAP